MTPRLLRWTDATAAAGATQPRAKARLVGALKAAAVAFGLATGSLGAYAGLVLYDGNFHAVQEHVLYRSAQPNKTDLLSFARRSGIKSVLNLRGAHAGEAWYDEELAAAGELGLAHYDYALSAKRFVTGQQIGEILAIVHQAPKPLLIHCKSGSDRTGLVAALYRFAVTGAGEVEADGELSLLYGHFPYLTSRTRAMDDSFWAYVAEHRRSAKQ